MSGYAEQLVGTLFRILDAEGHTDAHRALLEAYTSEAATGRDELTESLVVEAVNVLDGELDTDEQVDVLVTAIEQLLDRFAAVVAAAPVAIFVVDDAGRVQLWSDGAERIFGWDDAATGGRPYYQVLSADHDVAATVLGRLRAGEQVHALETRYTHREGSRLDVRVSAAPLRSRAGEFDGGVFVVGDITVQKQRAQRLAVLNRVLRHNIRNDVGVVQGYLEVLADDLPSHDEHVHLVNCLGVKPRGLSVDSRSNCVMQ
jgi:PAS domain S-box-containing protein